MMKNENYEEFDQEVKEAFQSVKGYRYVRNHLMRIAEILRGNTKFKAPGSRDPSGLILFGERESGKTTLANCLIRAAGRPLFQLHHTSRMAYDYEQMKELFQTAVNHAPSIVFLDDLDQFAARSAFNEVQLQKCIDFVKDKNVFVLLTTTNYSFREKLIRPGRIDISLDLDFLDQEDICDIVQSSIRTLNVDPEITPLQIAKILSLPGTTPLEIYQMIDKAAMGAAEMNHSYITALDFFYAYLEIKRTVSVFRLKELYRKVERKDLRQKAYEVAAKVVALEVMCPGSVEMAGIYLYDGGRSGAISKQKNDGEYSAEREEIYERNMIGDAASRMIDIMKYGIVNKVSFVQREQAEALLTEISADGIWFNLDSENNMHQEQIDIGIQVLAVTAEKIAVYILMKHSRFVDALADAIFQKEILLSDQIQECRRKSETLVDTKAIQ